MGYYASLSEVYGDDFTKKYEHKNTRQSTHVDFDKDPTPLFLRDKRYNNEERYKVKSFNSGNMDSEFNNQMKNERRYIELKEKGQRDMNEKINNMNVIERQSPWAPLSAGTQMNNDELMKKYNHNDLTKRNILMERLKFLEEEMNKNNSEPKQQKNSSQTITSQENFTNSQYPQVNQYQNINSNLNQEFIDLFFLIVMGLILLYIFESIYKFGKIIGAR